LIGKNQQQKIQNLKVRHYKVTASRILFGTVELCYEEVLNLSCLNFTEYDNYYTESQPEKCSLVF